jgi:nitrite reductase/ring-hydroxylating ferredoxin subunit
MFELSRKQFLKRSCSVLLLVSSPAFLSTLFGCKRGYTRAASELNLGEVKDLLYNQQLVRDRDILVNRDPQGWSAMSTQCSYEGCALSYQEERFLCTCCGSVFDHGGTVLKGPAESPLPFFEVKYLDGNLYADSSKVVGSSYRFISPPLQEAITRLEERIKKEGTRSGSQIPDILLGKGDQTESGPMFEEKKLPPREISSEEPESTEGEEAE